MKRLALIIFVAAMSLPFYSYAADLGSAYISYIQGDVQINTEETAEWTPASVNMPLKDSDRIWVAQAGRAEIRTKYGPAVRLNELTSMDIVSRPGAADSFKLNKGSVYFNYNGGSTLNITTPTTTLWTTERSRFRVDVSETGFAEVTVLKGRVNIDNQSIRVTIPEGRYMPYTGRYTSDLRAIGSADEWDRWNAQRDGSDNERYASSRYLPEELSPYSRDFDTNGRWVYVRDYGYCWQPVTLVSVGWAPYRAGRWVWVRGDYVWVSYEPWGWAPYHYGRWAHAVSYGWVWVPPARGAVYWGPGFVAWVNTPTHVAWVPLAPREIYYGRGYYGPHSVNITNITVNKTVVNRTAYRNLDAQHAVTAVSRDSFIAGRPMVVKSENIFQQKDAAFGRPDVKFESLRTTNTVNNRNVTITNNTIRNSASAPAARTEPSAVQFKSAPAPLQKQREFQPQRVTERPQKPVQTQRDVQPQRSIEQFPKAVQPQRSEAQQREMKQQPQRAIEPQKQVQMKREVEPPQRTMQTQREQPAIQQKPVQTQRDIQQPQRVMQQQREMQQREQREFKNEAPRQKAAPREQQIEKEPRSMDMKNDTRQNAKENFRSSIDNKAKGKGFGIQVKSENQQRDSGKKDRS